MTPAERMAARLAATPTSEHGTPCRSCHTSALACQHRFVTLDEKCCASCRIYGGGEMHR